MALDEYFPNLIGSGYRSTSPASTVYNCFAWAAGYSDCWWEPSAAPDTFWPPGVPRERAFPALVQAYQTIGFVPADTAQVEPGFEKVALYGIEDRPTHAARQLPSGNWTSKLGDLEDIEHSLDGLAGSYYGTVVQFLKRPIPQS